MSKRNIAIAAAALAFALGCEERRGGEIEVDERPGRGVDVDFDQGPGMDYEDEPLAEGPQARQPRPGQAGQQQPPGQVGQQQQGQMGQQMRQPQMPGEVVSMNSEHNFARTITQLTREMRENNLDVVAQIRYDEGMRRRVTREATQQAQQQRTGAQTQEQRAVAQQQGPQAQQQTGQAQGDIGDVRVIVFRRTNDEARMIEHMGPEAILDAPRELLVYERGDNVVVAYRTPHEVAAPGAAEPTAEVLNRVVREATQPQARPTAQLDQQQADQQASARPQEVEVQERQVRIEPRDTDTATN